LRWPASGAFDCTISLGRHLGNRALVSPAPKLQPMNTGGIERLAEAI
jgi:hypothetical protein